MLEKSMHYREYGDYTPLPNPRGRFTNASRITRKGVKQMKKAYQKPQVMAQGSYSASLNSCGSQVSSSNSNCGKY